MYCTPPPTVITIQQPCGSGVSIPGPRGATGPAGANGVGQALFSAVLDGALVPPIASGSQVDLDEGWTTSPSPPYFNTPMVPIPWFDEATGVMTALQSGIYFISFSANMTVDPSVIDTAVVTIAMNRTSNAVTSAVAITETTVFSGIAGPFFFAINVNRMLELVAGDEIYFDVTNGFAASTISFPPTPAGSSGTSFSAMLVSPN